MKKSINLSISARTGTLGIPSSSLIELAIESSRKDDLPVIVRPYLPARVSDDDYDDWSDNFAYNGTEL